MELATVEAVEALEIVVVVVVVVSAEGSHNMDELILFICEFEDI